MGPGEVIADRFEVERLAGEGGMAAVYRAIDRLSGGPVAIKMLHRQGAEEVRRFAREALLLAEIPHPGIVRYVAHGVSSAGDLWLAMEWLDGEDLEARLQRAGLDAAESLRVIQRVAAILGFAHGRRIVHRDLKPTNLFLVDSDLERVKVLDFGIARMVGARHTTTGAVVGTPSYMAPEQARADRSLDARADVFALGCVLFECLTGRPPFLGEQVMAVLAKILLEEAPRLRDLKPEVSPEVDALVARMLAKDPAERPTDGAALAEEIEGLLGPGDRPSTTPRISARPRALTTGEQRLVSVVLVGAGAHVALDRTLRPDEDVGDALASAASSYGVKLERLADGTSVIALVGSGAATDQARRAARCALGLAALSPAAPIALATGLAELSGRFPVGDVIDRAARLLSSAGPGVWIDELTAGLVGARFLVAVSPEGARLLQEDTAAEPERTLLGKATPCVGRERELGVLVGLFEECATEPLARAVLVTAPAGAGKSRLRQELQLRLASREGGLQVWTGRGDPMSAGSPFAMLSDALRGAAGLRDGEPVELRRQKLAARVARSVDSARVARVAIFLAELVGAPFPDAGSVELRAARQDPMLMGDQMRRAWEDFLCAECGSGPVLLVLEDLHWGDLPTIGAVDAALRNLRDQPFMVLALARPEVHEAFPGLWSDRRLQEVRLEELGRRASEKLVRAVLGDLAPDRLGRIVDRAAGNPFFLEELIRAEAVGAGHETPDTVLAMVHARLEALPQPARRVLRAASVFGQVAWRGGLEALLGEEGHEASEWLAWLAEAELLLPRGDRRFPGEEEYAFRHALVQQAAYESLTPSDRQLGHRMAGDWLASAGETDALVLAEHRERGGLPERAIALYRRAATQALRGNDLRAVIARVERGVACGAEGDALGSLRLLEAEARQWSGDHAGARAAALEALALLPAGSARCYAAAGEAATASGNLGLADDVLRVGDWLASNPPGPDMRAAYLPAAARAAVQLMYGGHREAAEELFDRMRAAREAMDEPAPAAEARWLFAQAYRQKRDDPGAYLRGCEAAAQAAEAAGDLRYACTQQVNVGFALMELGSYESAVAALRASLAGAERLGLPIIVAGAKHNLGFALARSGRAEDGRRLELESVNEFARLANRRLEGSSRLYLARIALACGDREAAEAEAREALASLETARALRPYALAVLAETLLAAGRTDEAVPLVTESIELLGAAGTTPEGESLVRLLRAELCHALGDEPGAWKAIALARDNLLARAGRIGEPQLRETFLHAIPENERTLLLAREWLVEGPRDVVA